MTERLLSFLFFAVLLALGYHWGLNLFYRQFLADSALVENYWLVPFVAVPALLLVALGWMMGFFRRAGWADLAALGIIAATTFLTIPASYSCGTGCF